MSIFLGVDGGTKTHALIANERGKVLGFGAGGPGNWEGVGVEGMPAALQDAVGGALKAAGLEVGAIDAAGMGLAGYDWPCQKEMILGGIAPLGLTCPLEIVNDATLGILAGTTQGWGVSVVSGTGNNCRGWSRDGREGRMVGGMGHWSGEFAGGWDMLQRAVRAVVFEWNRRGPATALSGAFLELTGAKDLFDLIEGLYVNRYELGEAAIMRLFEVAAQGDPQALEVMRWAGRELGEMACGVIRQLGMEAEAVEVVQIGSAWKGHPLLTQTARRTIRKVAPKARLLRLNAPPVVGGVVLAMQRSGLQTEEVRKKLIRGVRGEASQRSES